MGTRQSGEPVQGVLLSGDTRLFDEVSHAVSELFDNPVLREEKEILLRQSENYLSENILQLALN